MSDVVKQMIAGYEAIRGPMNPRPEEKKVCEWVQEDWECDCWNTTCGHAFCVNDGDNPEEHGMKFCCFCGLPLVATPYKEEDEDDEEETSDQGA